MRRRAVVRVRPRAAVDGRGPLRSRRRPLPAVRLAPRPAPGRRTRSPRRVRFRGRWRVAGGLRLRWWRSAARFAATRSRRPVVRFAAGAQPPRPARRRPPPAVVPQCRPCRAPASRAARSSLSSSAARCWCAAASAAAVWRAVRSDSVSVASSRSAASACWAFSSAAASCCSSSELRVDAVLPRHVRRRLALAAAPECRPGPRTRLAGAGEITFELRGAVLVGGGFGGGGLQRGLQRLGLAGFVRGRRPSPVRRSAVVGVRRRAVGVSVHWRWRRRSPLAVVPRCRPCPGTGFAGGG